MKKRQSSLTALGIATVRAMESAKPEGERLLDDPYARQFVPDLLYHFIAFFDRLGYGEKKGPGVMGFLVTRDRYIDDVLRDCLQEGLEQLVILGAGYDARAYRFRERLQGVQVFEVDHPLTQEKKVAKVRRILGQIPAHVTYVPIDFNEQSLGERLPAHGYDPARTTLFIWQGVTQYITAEAVDATLAFIAHHAAPGSTVVFDYMEPRLLEEPGEHGEITRTRRYGRFTGEQFHFGIAMDRIEAFLESRGFCDVINADRHVLEARYYPDGARTVANGYAIARARVCDGTGSTG